MKSFLYPVSTILFLALFLPVALHSQGSYWIGDDYSGVQVTVDEKGGRFFFTSGNSTGRQRYLYGGSSTDATVTSNVVFRLQRSSGDQWFTNNPVNFFLPDERPQTSNGPAKFAPFDSIYISPGEDTLEIIWKNLGNTFFIKQRFVVEGPRHEYDDGSDILLEYEYRINKDAPAPANLGIFLMLDQDNRFVSGSDDLPLLSDRGYLPNDEVGGLFQKRFGTMPEYYLVGRFEYREPIIDQFSVHRIRGTSLGGAPLDEPDELAVGAWQDFRKLSWLINGDVTSKGFSDLATAMRWENLGTGGMIRTAFGTSSREGNNLYTCRDTNLFVVIRTERVVRQEGVNGPYQPASFDIEMWVTNLHRAIDQEIEIGFEQPPGSFPAGTGRLRIDPSSPAIRPLILLPRQTKKLTWRANVNPNSSDTLVELNVLWRDSVRDATPLLPLKKACRPKVSFLSASRPPPPDDRDPVIQEIADGRDQTRWWTFRTFDRHAGFRYDTGLDKIEVERNDGNNMRLIVAPNPFDRCDTSETVDLRFEVIDTTRSALMSVRVLDCEGNSTTVQRAYTPRPDPFVPRIVRIDSVVQYDPVGFPCAAPIVEVTVKDTIQTAEAGDIGFGSVSMLDDGSRLNVLPLEVNYHRSQPDITPGDKEVRFRITVADTMFPASARVVFTDLAGNADTFDFVYCPLPDTAAPVFSIESGTGPAWSLEGSDTASWDRGLLEVVEISNTNMSTDPLSRYITSGDRAFDGLGVSVVDDAWPAEVTLELRDTWYEPADPSTHDSHSSRLTLRWPGTPDTLAPIINITRDLTVPGNEVVFNVAIVDSHEVGGDFYLYDRGIQEVSWRMTPNMTIRTPLSFTDNRRGASFSVEVIDLFALTEADTICVSAVDSAGNAVGEICRSYPIEPDELAPIFRGRISPDRTALTGRATDVREKDRGLFEISLRNTTNIEPVVITNLDGQSTADITANISDPSSPVAGEVVVRDLHGELEGLSEGDVHTTVIPFSLPVVVIELTVPRVVEGGEEFSLHLVSQSTFSGKEVPQFAIPTRHSSNGIIVSAGGPASVNTMQARSAAGVTTFSIVTNSGFVYEPGDTLGTVIFRTDQPDIAEIFTIDVDHSSIVANADREDTIRVFASGDSIYSELILPPPAIRVVADSQTVVNGVCVRLLSGGDRAGRSPAPEILGAFPNPAEQGAGSVVTLYVRGLPLEGVEISLLDNQGDLVTRWHVSHENEGVGRVSLNLPVDIPGGSFYFMLQGESGTSVWPVIVR